VDVLRGRLTDMQEMKERYQAELAASENRLERYRSRTVQATQPKAGTSSDESAQLKGETEDEEKKPSSPAVSGLVNGWESCSDIFLLLIHGIRAQTNGKTLHDLSHEDDCIDIAEVRARHICEQDNVINELKGQLINLQAQVGRDIQLAVSRVTNFSSDQSP
jgi:hypothetical protein